MARDMYKLQEEFNDHTCSVILRACESCGDITQGEQVHAFVIKRGLCEDVIVGTSLISMYSKSGYLEDAEKLYSDLTYKDVRCMNLLISEYGKLGYGEKAIWVFFDLLSSGLEPTDYTFTNVISACKGYIGVGIGRQLHGLAVKHGLVAETSVGNALTTMYGKHGMVEEAERMFSGMCLKNLVSWTAILSAFVKNGHSEKALRGFLEMIDFGIFIDSGCLATAVDSCSECKNLALGVQIHGMVAKFGFLSDITVGTALIDLYAKCGNLQAARLIFNALSDLRTASFNALLAGYTKIHGENDEDAMGLLNQLRLAGIKPDSITFARFLSFLADQASFVSGKTVHAYAIKTGFEVEFNVGNSLISMYAKRGCIEDAYQAFIGMNKHDLVSWNAMISAYALHGQGKKSLSLFEEMVKEGFVPDEITILGVLQACSFSNLWNYGYHLFAEMELKYGIMPVVEHFACVVDLVGRAGKFAVAMNLIDESSFSNSPLLWRTLIHSCKLHGNLLFGGAASKRLLDLAPKEAGSYISVSNLNAAIGMLDEAARVRTLMNDLKLNKDAGCSWIEIDNETHWFIASGKDHQQSTDIYALLDLVMDDMKQINDCGANLLLDWEPA